MFFILNMIKVLIMFKINKFWKPDPVEIFDKRFNALGVVLERTGAVLVA